ncbi:hypothetical protein NLJ89_g2355 [Agrocybe chaxingu]|uniref:Tc1-like transposase DDE domain-containing protein n=1 Tax=Agrocybe chaxingu TaxID=84603 RepID=A0A9W8KCD3_9AGAR|nr:hypothetical protein NLJ89_g2355 [Agrocybe chaxingu]
MNSTRYHEQVLDGVLMDFYKEMKKERGRVVFQQDNAPSHKSKVTWKWFADHGIPLLYHPPNSPDLSPIEPVWHELKRIIRRSPHPPNTVDQLRLTVLAAWQQLDVKDVDKHILSMPKRVEALSAANGGHIHY